MIRPQRMCSTRKNVLKEGKRLLMPTEAIKVERLKPLRRQRAGVVWPEKKPNVSHTLRPELHCFLITTQALQSLRDLDSGLQCHCGFGPTMTDRPVESGLRGLKSRLGIRIHLLGGALRRLGDAISQPGTGSSLGCPRRWHCPSVFRVGRGRSGPKALHFSARGHAVQTNTPDTEQTRQYGGGSMLCTTAPAPFQRCRALCLRYAEGVTPVLTRKARLNELRLSNPTALATWRIDGPGSARRAIARSRRAWIR